MPLEIIKARIRGRIQKSDCCLIFAIHQLVAVQCNECILDVSVWKCAIWCGSLRHSVSLCKKLPVIHTNTLHKSWYRNLRRLEMVCRWLVQFIYSLKKIGTHTRIFLPFLFSLSSPAHIFQHVSTCLWSRLWSLYLSKTYSARTLMSGLSAAHTLTHS